MRIDHQLDELFFAEDLDNEGEEGDENPQHRCSLSGETTGLHSLGEIPGPSVLANLEIYIFPSPFPLPLNLHRLSCQNPHPISSLAATATTCRTCPVLKRTLTNLNTENTIDRKKIEALRRFNRRLNGKLEAADWVSMLNVTKAIVSHILSDGDTMEGFAEYMDSQPAEMSMDE